MQSTRQLTNGISEVVGSVV